MPRIQLQKQNLSKVFACFWFFCSPPVDRPDVRHWSDDLYRAAPQFSHFEDFISDFDIDKDRESLEEEAVERANLIKELESTERSTQSAGQLFHHDKQLMDLLLQQSVYLKFKLDREFYYQTGHWRRLELDDKLQEEREQELENLSLKTLGLARNMVNQYTFEADTNLSLLIRLMGRINNPNILLFFDQFKKKYSASSQLPVVYHIMGEYHFHLGEWDKAEAMLKAAMEAKESTSRPYTVFKLGWLHIMRSQGEKDPSQRDEALRKAVAAFRLSLKLIEDGDYDESLFNIKGEALKDLAWTLAESRAAETDVLALLTDFKETQVLKDYRYYLAVDSSRDGDAKRASEAFAQLLPVMQTDRELPRILLNQGETYRLQKNYSQLIETYKSVRALLQDEAPWLEEHEDDPDYLSLVQKQLAHHIAFAAQQAHQEGEKLPDNSNEAKAQPAVATPGITRQALFSASQDLYKLYGEWFPQGDALEDAAYNNALSLFYLGNLDRSVELLTTIAGNEKSKFRREASYNAVMVAAAWDGQQKLAPLPALGKAKSPIPFPKVRTILLERIEAYLKDFPNAEEKRTLQYMAAQSYFEYGYYPEALRRFDVLINEAPETEQGEASLHAFLNYQVEAQNWTELIETCQAYLKNKRIIDAGHRKIIRQTLDYAKGQTQTSAAAP